MELEVGAITGAVWAREQQPRFGSSATAIASVDWERAPGSIAPAHPEAPAREATSRASSSRRAAEKALTAVVPGGLHPGDLHPDRSTDLVRALGDERGLESQVSQLCGEVDEKGGDRPSSTARSRA